MTDVKPINQGVLCSISQLATEFGMTRETVAKRIADAGVAASGERSGYPVYRLKSVLPALLVLTADGRVDPEKLDPFRRKAHYQAEAERLDLERQAGDLIPRIEVEREQARVFTSIAQRLEVLTDVVERDCGMTSEQIVRLEKAVNEMRQTLYEELAGENPNAVRDSA